MRTITLVLVSAVALCARTFAQPDTHTAEAKNGMVVCVSPLAADVGAAILKQGGNAVDAAVAVGIAEAVTWPEAGNIGGGGFMLVWPGGGREPVVIDYREMAPAASTVDMFAREANPHSHKISGVPGTVRGMAMAHAKFGKLPWKAVVLPAAKLADGMPVNMALARSLNGVLKSPATTNAEFRRVYGKPDKTDWRAGDTLTLPDLGKSLRLIAKNGADAFYTGELADKLADEMNAGGGIITKTDLANYKAKERKPVRGSYRGYEVLSNPPPSGGGILLVEMLNVLENFDLKRHPRTSTETLHLMTEAMRRAYRDRARWLGDPEFTRIPAHLTEKEYAKGLAASIDPVKATKSESLAVDIPLTEGGTETTHYTIADKSGMVVSNTYTLEHSFGSRIVVRGAGYILNNQMADFNARPGVTDRTGRVGTKPNLVAPGKRMLSSQCPTILLKDGQPILTTGSPGGRTIPNTVLSIVVNVVDYGMPPRAAIDAPRMHHQWFPDQLNHEDFPTFPTVSAKLTAMGHAVRKQKQGDAHSIFFDPKTGILTGVADKRLDGKAAGF